MKWTTKDGQRVPDWTCQRCQNPTTLQQSSATTPAPVQNSTISGNAAQNNVNRLPKRRRQKIYSATVNAPSIRQKQHLPDNDERFKILQWNCEGVRAKRAILEHLIAMHAPQVIMIQESKLASGVQFVPPKGYNAIRKDRSTMRNDNVTNRGRTHGGVLMLISSDLNYEEVKEGVTATNDNTTEFTAAEVQVPGRKPIMLINLYIPCIREVDEDQRVDRFDPDALRIDKQSFVCGDFNAHSASWDRTYPEDERGKIIESWMANNNFIAANDGTATRINRATGGESTPDVTLHHGSWAGKINWECLDDGCSDHLPVLWSFKAKEPLPRRKPAAFCYSKANWYLWNHETEEKLKTMVESPNVESTSKLNDKFIQILLDASKKYIPKGSRRKPKCWWSSEASRHVSKRKELRREAKTSSEKRKEYNRVCRESLKQVNQLKADKFKEGINALDPRSDPREIYGILRSIDGRGKSEHPSVPMTQGNRQLKTDAAKSDGFVKEYAKVSNIKKADTDREVKHQVKISMKQRCSCFPSCEGQCSPFSIAELNACLNKIRAGKAPGEDKVSNDMLKRLKQHGRLALLKICNSSWKRQEVPTIWRRGTIIPILKAGKPAEKPGSYRPICLTSCIGKVMERLVQQRLVYMLESKQMLNPCQAGFRALHSTEDQCIRISQAISDGFQEKPMKRTVLTLVDFKRAFDTVWRVGLYTKLLEMKIPMCYIKWIKQFLSDRYAKVSFGVAESKYKRFLDGLPQGSVLSPVLFTCFINDITENLPDGIHVSLFADDLALWSQDTSSAKAEEVMQQALKSLEQWSCKWKLEINTDKTEVAFFTTHTREAKHQPKLKMFDKTLGFNKNPTFLGVTYDRVLSFGAHVAKVKQRMMSRAKALGAMSGTAWGCWKDDRRLLYMSYIRAVADYCAAAWTPYAKSTQLQQVEVAQNNAARKIVSCTAHTPTDSLLVEAKLDPFEHHAKELSTLAYEKAMRLPSDNPRRIAAEGTIRQRSVRNNWRDTAKAEIAKTELYGLEREQLVPVAAHAPWYTKSLAEFRTQLSEPIRRSDPVAERLRVSKETVASLSGGVLEIYTDGSAVNSNRMGGAGAYIKRTKDNAEFELMAPAGELTCSYRAELVAIRIALEKVYEMLRSDTIDKEGRIVIFTDSKSAVERLSSRSNQNDHMLREIWKLLEQVADNSELHVVFQWIPGHSGLEGNERVDSIAKRATNLEQSKQQIDWHTAKATLRMNSNRGWMEKAKLRFTNPRHFRLKQNKNIAKQDQALLARMRTGGFTPHLAWYRAFITRTSDRPESATCPQCRSADETVEHVFRECPAYAKWRFQLWSAEEDPLNSIFVDEEKALQFLRKAGIAGRL